MEWILGNKTKDLTWLILPGLLMLAVAFIIPPSPDGIYLLILVIIARGFIDSGHIATTWLRTYANPRERQNKRYFLAPIAIFLLFFIWLKFQLPGLWAFVIYSTLFHNFRQFYGISRWYQKLNGRLQKSGDLFLHLLCLLPVLGFHFRDPNSLDLYFEAPLLPFYPRVELYFLCVGLYLLTGGLWLLWEWTQYLRVKKQASTSNAALEYNRIFAIALPATLYGVGLFGGKNIEQIFFPMIAAHGLGYMAMTGIALKNIQKISFKKGTLWAIGLAMGWGSLVLLSEYLFLDNYTYSLQQEFSLLLSLAIALYLTPLYLHYYYDALIWKGSHSEAKLVFARSSEPKTRSQLE